jgi:hypothetical protein
MFAAALLWRATLPRPVHDSDRVIALAARVAPLMPPGATVTVLRPSIDDATLYFTAVGRLPSHRVVAPALDLPIRAQLPRYVIAVGEPLRDDDYRLVAQFEEGALYEVVP